MGRMESLLVQLSIPVLLSILFSLRLRLDIKTLTFYAYKYTHNIILLIRIFLFPENVTISRDNYSYLRN